jgi:hypothetical protein
MTKLTAIQIRYDLSTSLAKILLLLVTNKVVTPQMIQGTHKLTKDAKVAMHRLRRRLEPAGIEVKSMRDVGYWLEYECRKQIHDAIAGDQLELPLGDTSSVLEQ